MESDSKCLQEIQEAAQELIRQLEIKNDQGVLKTSSIAFQKAYCALHKLGTSSKDFPRIVELCQLFANQYFGALRKISPQVCYIFLVKIT